MLANGRIDRPELGMAVGVMPNEFARRRVQVKAKAFGPVFSPQRARVDRDRLHGVQNTMAPTNRRIKDQMSCGGCGNGTSHVKCPRDSGKADDSHGEMRPSCVNLSFLLVPPSRFLIQQGIRWLLCSLRPMASGWKLGPSHSGLFESTSSADYGSRRWRSFPSAHARKPGIWPKEKTAGVV